MNGNLVNIASYQASAGDVVSVREKAQKQMRIKGAMEISSQMGLPDWVDVDEKKVLIVECIQSISWHFTRHH